MLRKCILWIASPKKDWVTHKNWNAVGSSGGISSFWKSSSGFFFAVFNRATNKWSKIAVWTTRQWACMIFFVVNFFSQPKHWTGAVMNGTSMHPWRAFMWRIRWYFLLNTLLQYAHSNFSFSIFFFEKSLKMGKNKYREKKFELKIANLLFFHVYIFAAVSAVAVCGKMFSFTVIK